MNKNKQFGKKHGKRKFPSDCGKVIRDGSNGIGSFSAKRLCQSEMNRGRTVKKENKDIEKSKLPPEVVRKDTLQNKKQVKADNVTCSKPHVPIARNNMLLKEDKSQECCSNFNSKLKISDENADSVSKDPKVHSVKAKNRQKSSNEGNSRRKGNSNTENESKESPNPSTKQIADVTHKKSTGNSNWLRFLKEHNAHPKKFKPPIRMMKTPSSAADVSKQKLTKVVALDCEMVGVGDHGRENMLARVSLVNARGDCIYDKFVKPREAVVDYRTSVSGVRPEDMSGGEDFEVVQKEVAEILKNRILVGHALNSDFDVLFLSHPRRLTRDTSRYLREPGKGTPSLKKLAAQFLGVKIQEGEHNSVQDARAAVQLYNMFRKEWESGTKTNHYRNKKDSETISIQEKRDT